MAPAAANGRLIVDKSLISLGGLLNVIDGASSQEVSLGTFNAKDI